MIRVKYAIFQKGQRYLISWLIGFVVTSSGMGQEMKLAPKAEIPATLSESMAKRMSVRQYSEQPVEDEKLSWLLRFVSENNVAGYDSGQVLIQMDDKTYRYDPGMQTLNGIEYTFPELRMFPAPVNIYLMPLNITHKKRESLWIWRGFIGQRIYLGASALGLGTVTIRGIGFPIGYPAESLTWSKNEKLKIDLPDSFQTKLEETVFSPKEDAPESIVKESLHALLWSAYGFSNLQDANGRIHRTVPSARGRYPMRLMLISSEGIFDYLPDSSRYQLATSENIIPEIQKSLNQEKFQNTSHFFVIIWNQSVLESRAYALYEAGASLANLQLAANALNHKISWTKMDSTHVLSSHLALNEDTEEALMVVGVQSASMKSSASVVR